MKSEIANETVFKVKDRLFGIASYDKDKEHGRFRFSKIIHTFAPKYQNMPQLTLDKIEYLVMLIKLFAQRYQLTAVQAYQYISHFGGIGFVDRNYGIMHTLSFNDMVDGLSDYCKRQGGQLG